jgi:uncharacterized protein (DUF1501 family)
VLRLLADTFPGVSCFSTRLSQARRLRLRQPRLRAVVPGADARSRRRFAPPKQLIAIFQRGAVDGLSVVVPFGETEYYRARPSIAIGRPARGTSAIDLDGFFGLHPRCSR